MNATILFQTPTLPPEINWTVQGMLLLFAYIVITQVIPKLLEALVARFNAGTSRQLAATETIKQLKEQMGKQEKRIDELEDMIRKMRRKHVDELLNKDRRIAELENKLRIAGIEP